MNEVQKKVIIILVETDRIPVGHAEDLTGKVFGKLTVLYRVKNPKSRDVKWRCLCSCEEHNKIDVFANNLKRGHTLSCGCEQKERASKTHKINEIGNRYGKLLVIDLDKEKYICESTQNSRLRWICQCDCGNIVSVIGTSLRRGLTQSCGCLQSEKMSKRGEEKYIGKTFHYITVLKRIPTNTIESKWLCKCNLCNKQFTLTTGKLMTQISCGCLKDSYGVRIIKELLSKNNILFETEKTFDTCIFPITNKKARFDFFVNNQYIIEFDGEQHFLQNNNKRFTVEMIQKNQERDKFKNEWCFKNNIPLIRIPYYHKDLITIEDLIPQNSKFLLINKGGIEEDVPD